MFLMKIHSAAAGIVWFNHLDWHWLTKQQFFFRKQKQKKTHRYCILHTEKDLVVLLFIDNAPNFRFKEASLRCAVFIAALKVAHGNQSWSVHGETLQYFCLARGDASVLSWSTERVVSGCEVGYICGSPLTAPRWKKKKKKDRQIRQMVGSTFKGGMK